MNSILDSNEQMKLIQRSQYIKMPWKNGLGLSEQIAVDENTYRFSVAHIQSPGPFSAYFGQERFLCVWKGEGLLLNQHELRPGQVYKFNGDETIFCKNLSPHVIDIGLIYDPIKVSAEMKLRTFTQNQILYFRAGIHFLFCFKGEFKVQDYSIQVGDTLKIEGEEFMDMILKSEIELVHIDLIKRP